MRDAEESLAAAQMYCELMQNAANSWRCHGLMAAAFAEKGDFEAALAEAKTAIARAPRELKMHLRSDLERYSKRIPPRLPERGGKTESGSRSAREPDMISCTQIPGEMPATSR